MDNDKLDDLKQFITATVSQTEQRLRDEMGEIRQEIKDSKEEIRQEMQQGFAGISEAIEGINEHQAEQDTRLTNLESTQA